MGWGNQYHNRPLPLPTGLATENEILHLTDRPDIIPIPVSVLLPEKSWRICNLNSWCDTCSHTSGNTVRLSRPAPAMGASPGLYLCSRSALRQFLSQTCSLCVSSVRRWNAPWNIYICILHTVTDIKTIFRWNMCSYFLQDSKRGLRVLCSCWSISTSCSSFTQHSSGTTGGAACALTPGTCAIAPHPPAGLHGAPEKGAAWRSCARGRGRGDVQHKQPG